MPASDFLTPLVEFLGEGAKSAFPFLRSKASGADSATSIYNQMRAAGFALRKQATLDIVALLRDKGDLSRFGRTFGENAPIPIGLHRLSASALKDGAKFQYQVFTNSTNPLTPEAIFVNSETPLSFNEVYGRAGAAFKYEEGGGMSPSDLADVVFTVEDARFDPSMSGQEGFVPPDFTGEGLS